MGERKFVHSVVSSATVQEAPKEMPEHHEGESGEMYEQKFVCNPEESKENDNG